MVLRTKGIGTDRYKLVPGVDGKDYSSKLKWLEGGAISTEFAVLILLIKELRLLVSCCQTCTGPVSCAVPKPAPPLHTVAFVKTVFTLLQRQMACLQPKSFVTC